MRITNLSYLAEYISTFFFIMVILVSNGSPFTIGAALAFAIYIVAGISGGHLNPAVSFTMWLKGAIPTNDAVMYMVAQLLGGASAYYAYQMTK